LVVKQSKNKEWAWKWLDFMESEVYQEANLKAGKYTGRKGMDPTFFQKYFPNSDVFIGELLTAGKKLVSSKYSEIREAIQDTIERVYQGMSNEDSIKQLKVKLTQILAN